MKANNPLPIALVSLLFFSLLACASGRKPATLKPSVADAQKFQLELNRQYANEESSILSSEQIEHLKENGGLNFYPINPEFQIMATFVRFEDPELVQMETSTERIADYQLFGQASFTLDGEDCTLNLYRSTVPNLPAEYRNKLFLPFRDATSGKETYGGGRYLDVTIPKGDRVLLDFNQAYHPYCAYNYNYSCPIPPKQNDLTVSIRAGIKNTDLGA